MQQDLVITKAQVVRKYLVRPSKQLIIALMIWLPAFSTMAGMCPKTGTPQMKAVQYQLFAAFQIGFDGYEAPCDLKCFSKENCRTRCQSTKAVEYLAKQMVQITEKNQGENCQTVAQACRVQCQDLSPTCSSICGI